MEAILCFSISYFTSLLGASQKPAVVDNGLVKDVSTNSLKCEKDREQDSKYLQPRWCPPGLSRTQKRRLQRMRKQETMEQQVEAKSVRPA